jgi:hypothetical protein
MRWWIILVAAACEQKAPTVQPTPPPSGSAWQPRCLAAGGRCVGPAAIQANPSAPCAAGSHRVDDVPVPGHEPACLGIPTGEEACCMPDR